MSDLSDYLKQPEDEVTLREQITRYSAWLRSVNAEPLTLSQFEEVYDNFVEHTRLMAQTVNASVAKSLTRQDRHGQPEGTFVSDVTELFFGEGDAFGESHRHREGRRMRVSLGIDFSGSMSEVDGLVYQSYFAKSLNYGQTVYYRGKPESRNYAGYVKAADDSKQLPEFRGLMIAPRLFFSTVLGSALYRELSRANNPDFTFEAWAWSLDNGGVHIPYAGEIVAFSDFLGSNTNLNGFLEFLHQREIETGYHDDNRLDIIITDGAVKSQAYYYENVQKERVKNGGTVKTLVMSIVPGYRGISGIDPAEKREFSAIGMEIFGQMTPTDLARVISKYSHEMLEGLE